MKIAVIGAGVMGRAIAAQIANTGNDVLLFDRIVEQEGKPLHLAGQAKKALRKQKPAPLMLPENEKRIKACSLEEDFDELRDVDWVLEAIIENLEIKQDLYHRLWKTCSKDTVFSSNTSTLTWAVLSEGMPESFKERFCITHFFNPPRYMQLLELVEADHIAPERITPILEFIEEKMGRVLVPVKDRPGFIANRIGAYWLLTAYDEAFKQNIEIEEADKVLSLGMGVPKTGAFGLMDLVGLDVMLYVQQSLENALPSEDAFHRSSSSQEENSPLALVNTLVQNGSTGRKGLGGFYRLAPDQDKKGKKEKQALDLKTGQYRKAKRPKLAKIAHKLKKEGLFKTLQSDEKLSVYLRTVLLKTLSYTLEIGPDVAQTVEQIDESLCLGYNWRKGPFELLDQLGYDHFKTLAQEEENLPHWAQGFVPAQGKGFYHREAQTLEVLSENGSYQEAQSGRLFSLKNIKALSKPVLRNRSASLWNIGEGVFCLEFHSKMNSINPWTLSMVRRSVAFLSEKRETEGQDACKALVIYNEGSNFSVGANIFLLYVIGQLRLPFLVEPLVRMGQESFKTLKFSPFPVVAAPSGFALGGGCEVMLHADGIQAHAETYTGLVEAGVGLIPGWGGCKELLVRMKMDRSRPKGPMALVTTPFELIAMAKVSTSAAEAQSLGFLRPKDGITMNRRFLLRDAKNRALEMATGYQPPEPQTLTLAGKSGQAILKDTLRSFRKRGVASEHDERIALGLATVLTGGDSGYEISEDELLTQERKAFMKLAVTGKSLARMKHILKTGKPLRN